MNRGYNFGAGPAMLPESILLEAQAELLNWHNLGMSILELGHRTAPFIQLLEETEELLRQLLSIPKNYEILFLGGAARTQFAMIPLNFLGVGEFAGYLISGLWSRTAYEEACKLKKAYCVASGEAKGFREIPARSEWQFKENSKYLYYAPNETINGVRFVETPLMPKVPLIADMTSCLLTEPINVNEYGLIFAGAQKNIANAGLTLVIIHQDLIATIEGTIPSMLDYRLQAASKSMYATPPTFNCYLALKMFRWVKEQGGVAEFYQRNCQKAAKLYEYLDSTAFYHCPISPTSRSLVNVCFSLQNAHLEERFLNKASKQGLLGLKGHRAVGGLRASLYNAMPLAGVERLIDFMHNFVKEEGSS